MQWNLRPKGRNVVMVSLVLLITKDSVTVAEVELED